jgi:hypothetical protein
MEGRTKYKANIVQNQNTIVTYYSDDFFMVRDLLLAIIQDKTNIEAMIFDNGTNKVILRFKTLFRSELAIA